MSSIVIRADASTRIGTGHVMRCLALAHAWQDVGGTVHFLCAEIPDGLAARLTSENIVLHRLQASPGSCADAEQTVSLAQQLGAEWVVEDGYHFGTDYQQAIKDAGLRLLAIDDYGHAGHYVADLVLNQNIYADESLYPSRAPTTELLLGTDYVLLRREFLPWKGWRRTIPDVARKILVTMGGGDPDNQTLKVIRAIQQITDLDLSVIAVVGGSNPHLATLERAISGSQSIRLVQNVSNMPELMAWADIAISTGGSTCWELCFLGTPSLVLIKAENQRQVVHGLASAGAIINLGWHEEIKIFDVVDLLKKVILSTKQREHMSKHGQRLVNGTGASSVLKAMQDLALTIRLRHANADDCRTIWEWANDPDTRQNSFHTEPIPWDNHVNWYNSKLADPNTLFFIATNDFGESIGYIRFEVVSLSEAVISVAVAPTHRGRGYGKRLIKLGIQEAQRMIELNVVHAYIKNHNQASIHAFTNIGFKAVETITINGCRAFHYVWHKKGDMV